MLDDDAIIPVADGLFEVGAEGVQLIGTHCTACQSVYFPRSLSCRNPVCRAKTVEPTLLPREGTLVSYTVQRYRPPPLFRVDDWEPYAIGLVRLDHEQALEVMGILSGIPLDAIRIGTRVRVVAHPLYDDERNTVITYAFTANEVSA
jgi:uncharacterized OB-fold protein